MTARPGGTEGIDPQILGSDLDLAHSKEAGFLEHLVKPIDPRSADTVTAFGRQPITSHNDITEANYAFWAATYDAVVEPPPALRVTTSKSYSRAENKGYQQMDDEIDDSADDA